jgi:hypothetical protein
MIGMCITFVVFPAVLQNVKLSFVDSVDWTSLIIVTLFNVSDTVGRTLGGIEALMFAKGGKAIHIFCFSRLVFVGTSTFLFLNDNTDGAFDAMIILNTMLLGLSNGYV